MSVAAGGLGAAGAEAKTGKIFACYSKKSKVMQYSKGHCAAGTKKISWNKTGPRGLTGPQGAQGPQGPQGAQGAQGAAGAVAGYTHYTGSGGVPSSSLVGVASFTPATAGNFAVTGMATFSTSNASVLCGEVTSSGAGIVSSVPPAFSGHGGFFAGNDNTNGILFASPGTPVFEVCLGAGNGFSLRDAAVTGVQLATANHQAKRLGLKAPTPLNQFRPKHQFATPKQKFGQANHRFAPK